MAAPPFLESHKPERKPLLNRPALYKAIVNDLLENRHTELKQDIKHTPMVSLIKFETGLAKEIRDKYGLFHNDPVVISTGHTNATDAALVIIYTVWQHLQEDTNPELAKLPAPDPNTEAAIRAAERYQRYFRKLPYE